MLARLLRARVDVRAVGLAGQLDVGPHEAARLEESLVCVPVAAGREWPAEEPAERPVRASGEANGESAEREAACV